MWQKEYEEFLKTKRKAQNKGDYKALGDVNCQIAALLQENARYADAVEISKENIPICEVNKDDEGIGLCHRYIGECLLELSEYEEALKHINTYLDIVRSNTLEEQRAWATLARVYMSKIENFPSGNDRHDQILHAKHALTKALDLCEDLRRNQTEKENDQMKLRLYLNQAIVFGTEQSYKEAETTAKEALLLSKKHNLQEDIFRCHLHCALLMRDMGKFDLGLSHVKEAFIAAKKLKNNMYKSECYEVKYDLLVRQEHFDQSRSCLKKAYKLEVKVEGETRVDKIKELLKDVTAICQYHHKLTSTTDCVNAANTFHLCEKLGDKLSEIGEYALALKYYKQQFDVAVQEEYEASELARICVSIAETCKDLALYSDALTWFNKELTLRGSDNKSQVADTYFNMAKCHETLRDHDAAAESYRKAVDNAKIAGKRSLCLGILEKLLNMYQLANVDCQADQDLYDSLLTESESLSDSEEGAVEKVNDLSDVEFDIDDLSECSSETSDDEDNETAEAIIEKRQLRSRAGPKCKYRRVNDRGETDLHVAAINGKLQRVKQLVEQGHPVNVRDNSGWLPIHEAANFGHTEIVEFLIDHGAWIDDAGGADCGGVTPLLDAATNGNLDIVQMLIEKGANIFHKDAQGRSIVDCLEYANLHVDANLHIRGSSLYSDVYDMVVNKYSEYGIPIVSSRSKPVVLSDSESTKSGEHSTDDEDSDIDEKGKGAEMYKRAMESIGSAKTKLKAVAHSSKKSSRPRRKKRSKPDSALVDEESFDAAMNKVIDDLPADQRRKRVCGDVNQVFRVKPSSSRKAEVSSKKKMRVPVAVRDDSSDIDEANVEDIENNEMVDDNSQILPMDMTEPVSSRPTQHTGQPYYTGVQEQPVLESNWIDNFISDACGSEALGTSDQFYIRLVYGKGLSPVRTSVPPDKTMDWLNQHACKEYCRFHSISDVPKPVIKLTVKDGSILEGTELVRSILTCNEELFVTLVGYEEISPSEVYRKLCAAKQRPVIENVLSQLQQINSSHVIDCSSRFLSGSDNASLLDALKMAPHTENIILPKNKLLNKHMIQLAGVCERLEQLCVLNVSQNFFTSLPRSLVDNLKHVRQLDLSGNRLEEQSESLAALFALPQLEWLNLDACGLTGEFLTHLAPPVDNSRLKYLSLQYNQLARNVDKLFEFLRHTQLSELRLRESFVCGGRRTECFSLLCQYLVDVGCAVRSVTLGILRADDLSVQHVCRSLIKNRTIRSLHAAPHNGKELLVLLAAISHAGSEVREVHLVMSALCKVVDADMEASIVTLVNKCCHKSLPIHKLSIRNICLGTKLLETLRSNWQEKWSPRECLAQVDHRNILFKVK